MSRRGHIPHCRHIWHISRALQASDSNRFCSLRDHVLRFPVDLCPAESVAYEPTMPVTAPLQLPLPIARTGPSMEARQQAERESLQRKTATLKRWFGVEFTLIDATSGEVVYQAEDQPIADCSICGPMCVEVARR